MGGFLLPFLERLGRFSKPWDFRVPGVTSMSADLHKYGYTPKGASVVMHRDRTCGATRPSSSTAGSAASTRRRAWPGTKPGAPIAAAWAALHYLGEDGYLRLAAAAHDAAIDVGGGRPGHAGARRARRAGGDAGGHRGGRRRFRRRLRVCTTASSPEGGTSTAKRPPDSLHATVHAGHAGSVVDEFLADLRTVVDDLGAARTDDRSTNYAALE